MSCDRLRTIKRRTFVNNRIEIKHKMSLDLCNRLFSLLDFDYILKCQLSIKIFYKKNYIIVETQTLIRFLRNISLSLTCLSLQNSCKHFKNFRRSLKTVIEILTKLTKTIFKLITFQQKFLG